MACVSATSEAVQEAGPLPAVVKNAGLVQYPADTEVATLAAATYLALQHPRHLFLTPA